MSAIILDGKKLSIQIKKCVKNYISETNATPGIAIVAFENNLEGYAYLEGKRRDCVQCGVKNHEFVFSHNSEKSAVIKTIDKLNNRADIHGILLQMPLPFGYCEEELTQSILPSKDVDGLHFSNMGRIMAGKPAFLPATPAGIMLLLKHYRIPLKGKRVVIIGRSNVVGKPLSMLFLQKDATVTVCHKSSQNLAEITRQADILISAAGVIGLVKADMIKPGAVVVDVAININNSGKFCGDVDFEAALDVASHITPVPGGIGPMTRAMLLQNVLDAYKGLDK